jgi:predicted amidophosphoribosyltransferase
MLTIDKNEKNAYTLYRLADIKSLIGGNSMFCPKCGAQVPDGVYFCPKDGTNLSMLNNPPK